MLYLSSSSKVSFILIKYCYCVCIMLNYDPWINQYNDNDDENDHIDWTLIRYRMILPIENN
jgi:hypothetical protein